MLFVSRYTHTYLSIISHLIGDKYKCVAPTSMQVVSECTYVQVTCLEWLEGGLVVI